MNNNTSAPESKKSLAGIDLTKFIASILIFTMHCRVFSKFLLFELLARWGVPFFFICSAYFLFNKEKKGQFKEAVRKYIHRIGVLYIVWMVYNLPSIYLSRIYLKDWSVLSTWLTFVRNTLLSSTFIGSWYLLSSIFSAFFLYILSKKFKTKVVLGICFCFYILCVASSVYHNFFPSFSKIVATFFGFPLNIFSGVFFFAIGKYIAENKRKVVNVFTQKRALFCFVVFYLLYLLEIGVVRHYHLYTTSDFAFSSILVGLFIFLFCMQSKIHIKNSIVLRKLSIIIFCAQGNVLSVNDFCLKTLGWTRMSSYLVAVCMMILICALVLYIQKRKHWKWADSLT